MRTQTTISFFLAAGVAAGCYGSPDESQVESLLDGAIFTTLADGTRVNANIYAAKTDVYLDGGPGDGAPNKAAALPAGDYYFQVTDPSGKVLLSSDPVTCRRFTVSADGLIVSVAASGACAHLTGADDDHGELGAITVQLMPYADTPNNGGEYKAWITPVDEYDADRGKHGFIPRFSKTDNFKVREPESPPLPEPTCGDGTVDQGEACDDGNAANGDGCSAICETEQAPSCGDGEVDTGEQCDDGNNTNGDGCSGACEVEQAPCCGDGNVDAGEQCDDGNTSGGDGCSATCQVEQAPCCGDGNLDAGEACDDGNTTNGDGCSSACQVEKPVCPTP